MKKLFLLTIASLFIGLLNNNLYAQTTSNGDLVATVSSNPDYVALGLAIRFANLQSALRGAGPYTIFAPNNIAFSNLSAGKLDSLMADPVKLATVLKGHVVSGKYDKAEIIKALAPGKATLTTLDGKPLILSVNEKKQLVLTDSDGNKALVIAFDMLGSNGVVIGIDAVLAK